MLYYYKTTSQDYSLFLRNLLISVHCNNHELKEPNTVNIEYV